MSVFVPGATPAGLVASTPPLPETLNLDMHQVTARVNYRLGEK
jgi:hypothetical protein